MAALKANQSRNRLRRRCIPLSAGTERRTGEAGVLKSTTTCASTAYSRPELFRQSRGRHLKPLKNCWRNLQYKATAAKCVCRFAAGVKMEQIHPQSRNFTPLGYQRRLRRCVRRAGAGRSPAGGEITRKVWWPWGASPREGFNLYTKITGS